MTEPTPQEIEDEAKRAEERMLADERIQAKIKAIDEFKARQDKTLDKGFAPKMNRHQRRVAAKLRKKRA